MRIFRSKHSPPRTHHPSPNEAVGSQSKRKQPIDYGGEEGKEKKKTHSLSPMSTSLRFHLVIAAWRQKKKTRLFLFATPRLTVAGSGGEGKNKKLRDLMQVPATGDRRGEVGGMEGSVMTAGSRISANTASNLLEMSRCCRACER